METEIYESISDLITQLKNVKDQLEAIRERLGDPKMLADSMEWLNLARHGLEKLQRSLHQFIDWQGEGGSGFLSR